MNDQPSSEADPRPRVVSGIAELRAAVAAMRQRGETIGLVPTMGALHEGHLSLVRAAGGECDRTVVSVFVNPTQFGPQEDLDQYPRTLASDVDQLREAQADLVFAPQASSMYPPGFSTYVQPSAVAQLWEGQSRPDHFRGVATIVLKLFHLIPADAAYFGHKDYQQTRVIQRMVQDLDVPIAIKVCPTVREADGLAMSSRNRYLSPQQREQALGLWRSLSLAREQVSGGQREATQIERQMREVLSQHGIQRIDYAALVDPETLESVAEVRGPVLALLAAYVGQTRLIDNLRLDI